MKKNILLTTTILALLLTGCTTNPTPPDQPDPNTPPVAPTTLTVDINLTGAENYVGIEDHPLVTIKTDTETLLQTEPYTGTTYLNAEYTETHQTQIPTGTHNLTISVLYKYGTYGGEGATVLYDESKSSECSIILNGNTVWGQTVEYPARLETTNGGTVKVVQNSGQMLCEYSGSITIQ